MNERMEEGYSIQRPPMFDGKFYTYWNNRIEILVKVENYQVWKVIEIGGFEVTTINSNNETIPKPITEYEKEVLPSNYFIVVLDQMSIIALWVAKQPSRFGSCWKLPMKEQVK